MSSKVVNDIGEELESIGLDIKKILMNKAYLIKENIKDRLEKHEIYLKEEDYHFTKSIIKNLKVENQSSIIGSWIIMSIIKNTKNIDGGIVELGHIN